MTTLTERLTDAAKKSAVIDDCCALIDAEVADKGGLSGIAVKAGYGVIKGIKPGFVPKVVGDLLPEFAAALEPFYGEAAAGGSSIPAHFGKNSDRIADALLTITDGKAQRSTNSVIKSTYGKLRGTAKKNVEQAVPRLAALVEKHTR